MKRMRKSMKSFAWSWITYPIRRVMFRHWKLVLALLVSFIIAFFALAVKPLAADATTTNIATTDENVSEVAGFLDESILDAFADTIEVSEVSEMMAHVSGLIDAPFKGAPPIIGTSFFTSLLIARILRLIYCLFLVFFRFLFLSIWQHARRIFV